MKTFIRGNYPDTRTAIVGTTLVEIMTLGDRITENELIELDFQSRNENAINALIGMTDDEIYNFSSFIRNDIETINIYENQKTWIDEIRNRFNYQIAIAEAQRLYKEVRGDLHKLQAELVEAQNVIRNQKIDFLTMMTLVFSAFTFLSINAVLIAGVAAINPLEAWRAFLIFAGGNAVVLLGLGLIFTATQWIITGDLNKSFIRWIFRK